MICEGCGCVFCWDDADEGSLSGNRKLYCGNTCKTKANKARQAGEPSPVAVRRGRQRSLEACALRNKQRFADRAAAEIVADEWSLRDQIRNRAKAWRPYKCPCGWWHLTSGRARGPAVPAQ